MYRVSLRPVGVSISSAAEAANLQPGPWRHAMRRVISVWFPTFQTDRLCRIGAGRRTAAPFVDRLRA